MPFDINTLREANAKRWAAAIITRGPEYATPVARILGAKDRYKAISIATGVPWYYIAAFHYRECGLNFSQSLAQGDPWDQVSRHVPAGRGPFHSFEDAAVDALTACPPYASRNKDWSLPGGLTIAEGYNGLKYAYAGVPSPYIWSGTNQYKIGKVIVDHGPIEPVVDKQLGIAGLILSLMAQDASIASGATSTAGAIRPSGPTQVAKSSQNSPTGSVEAPRGIAQEVLDWFKDH